jgi:hypothetical protein
VFSRVIGAKIGRFGVGAEEENDWRRFREVLGGLEESCWSADSTVEVLCSLFIGTSVCEEEGGAAEARDWEEQSREAEEERDLEAAEGCFNFRSDPVSEDLSLGGSLSRSFGVCLGALEDPGGRPLPLRFGASPPSEEEVVLRDFCRSISERTERWR